MVEGTITETTINDKIIGTISGENNIGGFLSGECQLSSSLAERGPKGDPGKNATINGITTLEIVEGVGITIEQTENQLKINSTNSYDDTEIRQKIDNLQIEKVDKEGGKQLSTNDYTTSEKNKLATLNNYDDSELRNLINNKQDKGNYALKNEIPTKTSDLENDSDYVKNTDYATGSKTGVIKTTGTYGVGTNSNGLLYSYSYDYDVYKTKDSNSFVSKGTLENVINGKELTDKNYVDNTIGNGTITIKQGGVQKGIFTTNQSENTEIDLDSGGESFDIEYMEILFKYPQSEYTEEEKNEVLNQLKSIGSNPDKKYVIYANMENEKYLCDIRVDSRKRPELIFKVIDLDYIFNIGVIVQTSSSRFATMYDAQYIQNLDDAQEYNVLSADGLVKELSNYVQKTDTTTVSYDNYNSKGNDYIISKGTLENVISGKHLDKPIVATTNPVMLNKNTLYDLGLSTSIPIMLPSSGSVGDWIEIDFISGSTSTSLLFLSTSGMTDFNLVPEVNKIYQLYFSWTKINTITYGWAVSYAEYDLKGV